MVRILWLLVGFNRSGLDFRVRVRVGYSGLEMYGFALS